MRIFYFYPTHPKPTGGNKQLRLQSLLLRELGVETYLLREQSYFDDPATAGDDHYYGLPNETASFAFETAQPQLKPNDILLLPEVLLRDWFAICGRWNVRIAVNNQNGFYGLRYRPTPTECKRIEFAFANAPYVAALCQRFYGLPPERIFLVPHWMSRPPFEPQSPDPQATLAVTYMPRKQPQTVAQVREAVQRQRPDVPWVEIDGVPEPEVARRMRSTRVFFAAQDLEGCPLTAMEAMACGNIVAGYPGTRSLRHPYATPANGFWAADQDVPQAVRAVLQALNLVETGGSAYQAMLDEGYATVRRYDREAVLTALREAVATFTTQSYSQRRATPWSQTWREWLYTAYLLYEYDQLGWPGQAVSWLSAQTKPLRRLLTRQRAGTP